MRIDRYLHCIRLVKSRTLAQAIIGQGMTRVDGKRVAKPSEPVKLGSIIALALQGSVRIIEVIAHPDRRGPRPKRAAPIGRLTEPAHRLSHGHEPRELA